MKKKPKVVKIDFLDHSQTTGGISRSIPCTVYGLLYATTKTEYLIVTWLCEGNIDVQNSDTYSIVKKTVTSMKVLGDA